jgi:hypothetical protein
MQNIFKSATRIILLMMTCATTFFIIVQVPIPDKWWETFMIVIVAFFGARKAEGSPSQS